MNALEECLSESVGYYPHLFDSLCQDKRHTDGTEHLDRDQAGIVMQPGGSYDTVAEQVETLLPIELMDGLLNGPTSHRPRGPFTCKMSLKLSLTDRKRHKKTTKRC